MLSNLKIQEKLGFGFGIVLLLMLIMATVGFVRVGHIKSNVEDIMDDRYPKVVLGNSLIKHTLDNGRIIRSAILASDANEIENLIKQAEANRKVNSEALGKIEKLLSTPKGREAFSAIVAAHGTLSSNFEKIYPLLRAQDDAKSTAFLSKEFAPSNNAFIASVENLNKIMSGFMDKGRDDALETISSVRLTMVITLAIAFLLGALVAYMLSKSLSSQINRVVLQSEKIAQGDFTAPLTQSSGDIPPIRTEIGRLLAAQEQMRTGLIKTLEEVRGGANQVSDSARELASVAEQVAASAQKQAASTSSASATLEELSVSIDHVSDNSKEASAQAVQAGDLAREGAVTVRDSVERIQSVNNSVQQTYGEMAELKEEVTQIGNIVTVISDVADQTNLLALNAAIEAARAGEAGRGFAVVADEVRKLAERTTTSAQKITQMVLSIQTSAERVVGSMSGNQHNVTTMTESSGRTSQVIHSVQSSAQEVLGAIANINTALGEQRIASQDLANTMEAVAQMAEENSATVEELATTSHVLMDLSGDLQKVVARFRW